MSTCTYLNWPFEFTSKVINIHAMSNLVTASPRLESEFLKHWIMCVRHRCASYTKKKPQQASFNMQCVQYFVNNHGRKQFVNVGIFNPQIIGFIAPFSFKTKPRQKKLILNRRLYNCRHAVFLRKQTTAHN